MSNLTKEQAIKLHNTEWWKTASKEDIVKFQLFETRLCCPFDVFQEAVEHVLKRPVWTHEFADFKRLQAEYLGDKPAPTFEEILNLIPADKRVVVVT